MDQTTPAGETAQLNRTALPGIEHTLSVTRPQTCDSSATTVPPSSMPHTEDSLVPAQDITGTLLSARPVASKDPPSSTNLNLQGASAQSRFANDQAIDNKQADDVSPEPAVESQIDEPVRKTQKGKRRAPPSGSKTKRPRLGASQPNLKKRTRAPTRKPRQVKGKKTPAAQGAPKKGRKKAQTTQNTPNGAKNASTGLQTGEKSTKNGSVKAGSSANDGVIVSSEKFPNPQPSQSKVGEIENVERGSSHASVKLDGCSASGRTAMTTDVDGRSNGKENNANQTDGKVTAEAECIEKGKQPSNDVPRSHVGQEQQKEKDRGTARGCGANDGTVLQNEAASPSESKGIDNTDKGGSDAQEEETLREKYEDLSRRYLSLVRGMLQSASDKKGEDCSDTDDEGGDGRAQTEIVDKKLYDTIYLCKVAGMLGAMKISDGPSNYVRAKRLRGVEDGYKRVMKDGFEFVEDLMKLGRPDENSCGSVKAVFRDVHIGVVKNIWERNEDKNRAAGLLLDMMTMIGEQIAVWYMKMMDGELSILWSELVGVHLAKGLYKNVVKMNEEVSEKFVSCLREILKYVSEYYQECEQKTGMSCLEKFCYSCEVCISIARSVPEAAISLEEEVAYVIGRHNGVFSHCVSRLVAKREMGKTGVGFDKDGSSGR